MGQGEKMFKPDSEVGKWYTKAESKLDRKKLLKFSSSPEAMVDYCLALGGDCPEVTAAESVKNMDKSLAMKDEGTRLFKEGDMRGARDAYSQSLQLYPLKEEDEENAIGYSIILANRSATLDAGRMFEGAVQDIDYAFKYGYPKTLQFKIYKRKGHALLRMKQYITSKEAFTKCLAMIGKSDMKDKVRDRTRASVTKQMNVFTVVKSLRNESLEDKPAFSLSGQTSDQLPEASALLAVSEKEKLVAADDLAVENVVLNERPVATILMEGGAEKRMCPHTLARIMAPAPCSLGSEIGFASEEIRTEAESSYHRFEWKVVKRLKEVGVTPVGRLALRMVTSLDKDVIDQLAEGMGDINFPLARAFALLELNKVKDEESVRAAIIASFFVRVLRASGYLNGSGDKLGAGEKLAARQMYRALIVSARHAMPISMPDMSQVSKQEEVLKKDTFPSSEFAVGVFPTFSRMCTMAKPFTSEDEPDAFSFFHNGKLVLQMNKSAKKGQELKLVSAVSDDGIAVKLEVINEMITFRCSNEACEGGFPLKENTKEKLITCPIKGCAKETNVWLKLKRVQDLKKLRREQVAKAINEENWKEVSENLRYLVAEWEKIVCRPYKEFANLERELRMTLLLRFLQTEVEWMQGHQ